VAAAKAKKHIYLEKPMALSTTDCSRVITAAKKNKVKLMVGHNYRYKPGAMVIKRIIDKKALGEIYEIRMQFVADIYDVVVKKKWREDPKKAGGGCLLELGIHELDMLRYWLGKEPDRVYAEMSYKGSSYPIERLACVMVGFKDCVCYLETGYKKRAFYVKEIHGEKGCLTINKFPDRNIITFTDKDQGMPHQIKDDRYSGHGATAMFIDAVAKKKEVPVTGEDGKKSTDIMLAAYLSAKEKRMVKLPLKEKVALPL
jgi:predicted dehydrogenase